MGKLVRMTRKHAQISGDGIKTWEKYFTIDFGIFNGDRRSGCNDCLWEAGNDWNFLRDSRKYWEEILFQWVPSGKGSSFFF